MDEPGRPRFHELTGDGRDLSGCAWGHFGDGDEVGTLGMLTHQRVRDAAALVRRGKVFSLNWDLDSPGPAILGRGAVEHEVIAQDAGFDDVYREYYPQSSSQWDSLAHVQHPVHGFYNGFQRHDVDGTAGHHLGIHNWGRRGIVGRFVLADVAAYRERAGSPLDCSRRSVVTVREIEDVLESQGTQLHVADILLIRFGWISWYEGLDDSTRGRLGDGEPFECPGLSSAAETAEWMWDRSLSAVAADNPALEAMPFDVADPEGFLHYRLIPMLGMAIGEMFDLEELSADCASDSIYAGMLTAAPFNKLGGIGSPANALAIK